MRRLTEQQANVLTGQLLAAAQELREHAAQHLYRADACKAVGERVLADFHRRRAASVHDLASALAGSRAVLGQRTSPVPVPRPRSTSRNRTNKYIPDAAATAADELAAPVAPSNSPGQSKRPRRAA